MRAHRICGEGYVEYCQIGSENYACDIGNTRSNARDGTPPFKLRMPFFCLQHVFPLTRPHLPTSH